MSARVSVENLSIALKLTAGMLKDARDDHAESTTQADHLRQRVGYLKACNAQLEREITDLRDLLTIEKKEHDVTKHDLRNVTLERDELLGKRLVPRDVSPACGA